MTITLQTSTVNLLLSFISGKGPINGCYFQLSKNSKFVEHVVKSYLQLFSRWSVHSLYIPEQWSKCCHHGSAKPSVKPSALCGTHSHSPTAVIIISIRYCEGPGQRPSDHDCLKIPLTYLSKVSITHHPYIDVKTFQSLVTNKWRDTGPACRQDHF